MQMVKDLKEGEQGFVWLEFVYKTVLGYAIRPESSIHAHDAGQSAKIKKILGKLVLTIEKPVFIKSCKLSDFANLPDPIPVILEGLTTHDTCLSCGALNFRGNTNV